jgi:hypothetical protein
MSETHIGATMEAEPSEPGLNLKERLAARRKISGKPDIFEAAKSGDQELVEDHVLADPKCVHKTDEK